MVRTLVAAMLMLGLVASGCQAPAKKMKREAAVQPIKPAPPAPPAPVAVYALTGENLNFLGMEQVYRRQLGLKGTVTKDKKTVMPSIRDAYVMGD